MDAGSSLEFINVSMKRFASSPGVSASSASSGGRDRFRGGGTASRRGADTGAEAPGPSLSMRSSLEPSRISF